MARTGRSLVAQREMAGIRFGPHRPAGSLGFGRAGEEPEEGERPGLRQALDHLVAGFQDAVVDRQRSHSSARGRGERQDRSTGEERWRERFRAEFLAGWQMDRVLQIRQPAAHACLHAQPGNGGGAHDRIRRVPDRARCAVDAGWQEAAADRRREYSGDGFARIPGHSHAAL